MNSIPSSSLSPHRQKQPQLLELPDDAIRAIISTIDKADNATLSNLVQTCKDLWQLAGADALRSFFYAAREAYETGDTHKKVMVYCVLADWIPAVANQLPEASRWQIIGHLSHMATIDGLAGPEMNTVAQSAGRLFQLARQEMATDRERLEARLASTADARTVQVSPDSVELLASVQRLLGAYKRYKDSLTQELSALNQRLQQLCRPTD